MSKKDATHKVCSMCKQDKPRSEFYIRNAGWLYSRCKECCKIAARECKIDLEAKRLYDKKYYIANRERIRAAARDPVNIERQKQQDKEKYKKNRDAIIARVTQYRLNNLDACKCYAKEYWMKNKEQLAKQSKAYYRKNKKHYSDLSRKKAYGLSPEDIDMMCHAQNNICPICGNELEVKFHVDHCHKTGKVRGLLHPTCNLLLGYAKDETLILQKAIEYLDNAEWGFTVC